MDLSLGPNDINNLFEFIKERNGIFVKLGVDLFAGIEDI